MTVEMAHNTTFARRAVSTTLNPFYSYGDIDADGTARIPIPAGMPRANTNVQVRIAGCQIRGHFPSRPVGINLPTNATANSWTHSLADFVRYDGAPLGSGLVFETIPGLSPLVGENQVFYDHLRASRSSVVRWRADVAAGSFQWRRQGDTIWNDIVPNQPLPEAIYNPRTNAAQSFEIQRLGDVERGVTNAISHTGNQVRYIILTQPVAPNPPGGGWVIARATSTINANNALEYLVFVPTRPDGRLDFGDTVIQPWTRVTGGSVRVEAAWVGYRIAFRTAATTARTHSLTANSTTLVQQDRVPLDLPNLTGITPALMNDLLRFDQNTGRLTINPSLPQEFRWLGYTPASLIDVSMEGNLVHWALANNTDIRPYMRIDPSSGRLTARLFVRIHGNANAPQSQPFRIEIDGSTVTVT